MPMVTQLGSEELGFEPRQPGWRPSPLLNPEDVVEGQDAPQRPHRNKGNQHRWQFKFQWIKSEKKETFSSLVEPATLQVPSSHM